PSCVSPPKTALFGCLCCNSALARLLLVMLLDRLHGRAHRCADESLLVVARPVVSDLTALVRLVDHGRDVPLPQLIGFLCVLEIRPVVGELQETAELALLRL